MGCFQSKQVDPNAKAKPVMVSSKDRKCRDVFWLLLFIAYWVGMVVVAITAFEHGDTARLLFAIDSHGNQCGGVDSVCLAGQQCGKFITYPRVNQDIAQAVKGGLNLADPTALLTVPYTGVCVSSCPEGIKDVNDDGKMHDWVCTYNTTDSVNALYDSSNNGKDVFSAAGRAVLEGCLAEKSAIPGAFAELFLSDSVDLPGVANDVPCKTLMSNCWKMYNRETDLFFRCIPQTQAVSQCMSSPYLEALGEPVHTMINADGDNVTRPANNEFCGTCLDPILDEDSSVMKPSDPRCKARTTDSTLTALESTPNPIFEQVNSWTALLTRYMGDIDLTKWEIIATGGGVSVVVGMVWLVLLRFFAGLFVWLSIWALFLGFGFLTVQFLIQGNVISASIVSSALGEIGLLGSQGNATDAAASEIVDTLQVFQSQTAQQEETFAILGYIMLGITVIYLLMVLYMRRRIRLAVGVLKEATKVVAVMPSIMLFPLLPVALSLAVAAYAVFMSMLIASSGEIKLDELPGANITSEILGARRLSALENATESLGAVLVSEFQSSDLNTWLFVYNFFGFLWTSQLISAVGATTVAGAVASHYWASEVESEKTKKMPRFPVLASLKRTLRFSLGSLAFGAFIIALVQLIRAGLAYLDKQTQELQKKNRVVKILFKLVQCCLWCFEKVLKYITKNAYIMIAIKGSSFCSATRDGFMILLNNFARIGVATAINNLLLLVAKLVITVAAGAACWLYVTNALEGDAAPSTPLVPVACTVILAWYVASAFMNVYALAVDTIMFCLCEDEKHNDGSALKPYYMPSSLQRIVRKSNKMYDQDKKAKNAAKRVADAQDSDDEDGGASRNTSGAPVTNNKPSEVAML